MKKGLWSIIAGAATLVAGIVTANPALIIVGAGMVISGVGTMLTGTMQGVATATRNSVAPQKVIYGRARIGGTVVYLNSFDTDKKFLDMVVVLAAHPCQSIDSVWFDQQRIQLDTTKVPVHPLTGARPVAGSGTSFSPVQQTVNINVIGRDANGIVTVTLPKDIPYLTAGDQIDIQNVTGDQTLNGTFQVSQIVSRVPFGGTNILTFQVLCGGTTVITQTNVGQVKTKWADYGSNVYVEYLLGAQTVGQTFLGMQIGTPYTGDVHKLVTPQGNLIYTPENAGPNPWTQYCSMAGMTAVFLRFHYDQDFFPQGLPQISFEVHGKKDIYDPRSDSHGYSENSALCVADYLSNTTWGFKAAYVTEIPTPDLTDAANICDEPVELANGSTEPRYTCNGSFDLSMKRGEVLQNMLTSCAGRLTYTNGQFRVHPAKWITPLTPNVDLQALATGPMRWRPTVSIRDLYNGVKGTYISPNNRWQSSDFPPYAQDSIHGYDPSHHLTDYSGDANLKADGGDRRWLDIQLPFTISAATAQRLAKIELLRRRHQGTGTFICNMSAYQYVPMDVVQADCSFLGWSGKELEISAVRLRSDKQGDAEGNEFSVLSTEIDVQETDSNIYTWSVEEELTPFGYVQTDYPTNTVVETVPYPWSPGYIAPMAGDVFEGAAATFGVEPVYKQDAEGNGTITLQIKGTAPTNALDDEIAAPLISCTPSIIGGSIPAGTYVVGLSARDAGSNWKNTDYHSLESVTIDSGTTGSITVNITWGSGDDGGDLYISEWNADGYVFHHAGTVTSTADSVTITSFDNTTPGGPDTIFDHFAIEWQEVIHSGPWAQQVQQVTSNTITIAGDGMTTNQWAGYTLSLLAKFDPTVEVPVLNMPVASSTASSGGFFTLTIGTNSHGHQLPNLTSIVSPYTTPLIEKGDLVTVRHLATFTDTSFSDPNIANPYYPNGADGTGPTGPEEGHVAVVLTGADAGDVRTIESVSQDGSGNYTTFNISSPWAVTPTTGDIVIVCAPSSVPQVLGASMTVKNGNVSGVMAQPNVLNLEGKVWLFRVLTQDANGTTSPDSLAPFREVYIFGQGLTRTVSSTGTMHLLDGYVEFNSATGDIVFTLLSADTLAGRELILQKVSADTHKVTVHPASGETFVDGSTTIVLSKIGDSVTCKF